MELVTKQIYTNHVGKKMIDQFVVDEDYNVPDSKRDVRRIVSSEGRVKVEDIKKVENYIRIAGKLYFQILYVTEGLEPTLASMEGKVPFEEMVYAEGEIEGQPIICDTRVEFTVGMIHSRKLNLRAMVELQVCMESMMDEEITEDIESDMPFYKKQRELEMLKLNTSKKDTYRLKEEMVLPGTKETIGNLLWSEVSNRKLDTRLATDTLMIFGEILVFCFYESPDGKLDWMEQAIPYEGRVECYGANESMYHQLNATLEDVAIDVRLDEDGEARVIGIEGTLNLRFAIYEEEKTQLLEDMYSLEQRCRLEKRETSYEELVMQNHSKCKLSEQLSLPELKNDILQICHNSGMVQIDHTEIVDEGIQVEGVLHISFLYVKANDEIPFDTWHGMVPFSYVIECNEISQDMNYDITSMLEQLSISLLGGDDVEVKAVLAFHCFLRRPVNISVITNVTMGNIPMEEMAKRPGIVGYIVKEGEELWDLAKRYCTTVEGIMEVNEMKDEVIKPGARILIFKENMSIL